MDVWVVQITPLSIKVTFLYQGRTPSLHRAIEELAKPSLTEQLLQKRVALPLLLLLHFLPLLLPSFPSLPSPSLLSILLLSSSLSLNSIHRRTSAHSLWSRLLTTISTSLDTKSAENSCSSRTVLLPSPPPPFSLKTFFFLLSCTPRQSDTHNLFGIGCEREL